VQSTLSFWRDDKKVTRKEKYESSISNMMSLLKAGDEILCNADGMYDSKVSVKDWMQLGQAEQEPQRAVSRFKVKLGIPSPVKKMEPQQHTEELLPVHELMEEMQTLKLVAADQSKQLAQPPRPRLLSPVEEGEQVQKLCEIETDASGAVRKRHLPSPPATMVAPPPPTAGEILVFTDSIASTPQKSRRRPAAARCLMRTDMATIDTEASRNVAVADAGIHEHLELLASATSSLDATWRELLQQSPGKNAAACASAETARQGVCVCVCVCVPRHMLTTCLPEILPNHTCAGWCTQVMSAYVVPMELVRAGVVCVCARGCSVCVCARGCRAVLLVLYLLPEYSHYEVTKPSQIQTKPSPPLVLHLLVLLAVRGR